MKQLQHPDFKYKTLEEQLAPESSKTNVYSFDSLLASIDEFVSQLDEDVKYQNEHPNVDL